MTPRAEAIAAAIGHLEWCNTAPHTLDKVIGIYAEHTSRQGRPLAVGWVDNDTLLDRVLHKEWAGGGNGGKGGHSDPTGTAAVAGVPTLTDDQDETIAQLTYGIRSLADHAQEADQLASAALGQPAWDPPRPERRQPLVAWSISMLHHLAETVDAAAAVMTNRDAGELSWILRAGIAEQAEWVATKAQGIWADSRGESKPEARQKALVPCRIHALHVTDPPLAGLSSGLCDKCDTFKRNHGCEPTGAIIGRWEWTKAATPSQIMEAKAAGRRG